MLATKFGMEVAPDKVGAAPDYVRRALHDSLERLQTDHIDLYQLHEPDPTVPIADTLAVLDDLVREGLVREIGCSNFTAAQQREAAEAVADGAARFVSVQNELSLLDARRRDRRSGGRGRARARVHPLLPARERRAHRQVPARENRHRRAPGCPSTTRPSATKSSTASTRSRAFAEERGRTLLELAIGWLLSLAPVASVITGATKPEQIEANVAASGWRLSDEERTELAAL